MSTTIQHGTGHTARHHHLSHTGIIWMLGALAVVGILAATVNLQMGDSPTRVDPVVHLGPNAGIAPDVINNQPAVLGDWNRGPNADLAPTWPEAAPTAAPVPYPGPNTDLAPDLVNNRPLVPNAGPNADLAPDLVGR